MRVIAGTARGVRLKSREGLDTRPTADRVKEAVFGSIQFDVAGARFLDLFAGSGAMGIEALSRGAREAVFVEKDKEAVSIIKQNLKAARLFAHIIADDCLNAASALREPFDFIFMDPPYALGLYEPVCGALIKSGAFGRDTLLIAEHDGTAVCPARCVKEKRYGRTFISFYRLGE